MDIERTHITTKLMKSVKPGEAKRYCDTELLGFQVWIGKKTVTYWLRKRSGGREYAIRLGDWPGMTVEEARAKAIERLGALANHGDINAASGRARPLLKDAFEYYASQLPDNRVARNNAHMCMKKFASWQDLHIDEITPQMVRDFHAAMKDTPSMANRCVQKLCAAMHKFCDMMDMPYTSPARGLKWYREKPRGRYVTKDEMPRFLDAVEKIRATTDYGMYCDMILMLLYTGARPDNVCRMMLEEISDGSWTIPEEKFKTGREHRIDLGQNEMDIIEKYRDGRTAGFVFPHRSEFIAQRLTIVMKAICAVAGMTDIRVYDLRRTLGTWMLTHGAPIAVVSQKLGHKSIRITETVYAHIMPSVTRQATDETIGEMRKRPQQGGEQ